MRVKYDNQYPNDDVSVKSGSKGFYIALAVCLVAVCGVAVATFVGGISTDKPTTNTTEPATPTTTVVQPADTPITSIPDDRTTTQTVTTTTTVPTTTTVVTTTTGPANLFVFPASNRVLLPYSDALIYSETLDQWCTHNGVDFAAKAGQEIKAPADGTISKIYDDTLWGGVIEIEHGGNVVSRCCGVKAGNIKEGKTVKAGSVIGTVVDIPAETMTDSHIHVEVLANDKYVDPLTLIRGETVTVPRPDTTTATQTATTTAK